jgi:hypothetical protein
MLKVLLGLLGVFLAAVVGLYGYMGGFTKVDVTQKVFDTEEIFYTTHKGPYEKLEESWTPFVEKYQALGIKDCDALSVYLDPPNTPPEELRTIIGCRMGELDDEVKARVAKNFSTTVLPEAPSYYGSFPYKNDFSFMFGPMMVYPAFQKLIAVGQINPSVSIEDYGYDKGRSEIYYYMPAQKTVSDYQALFDAFN